MIPTILNFSAYETIRPNHEKGWSENTSDYSLKKNGTNTVIL
jgi:hypothetical protein